MNIQNNYIQSKSTHPLGSAVPLGRLRSQGVLSKHEIDWCRLNGIEVAYDPIQIGWVALACEDDIVGLHQRPVLQAFQFRAWTTEDAPVYAEMLSSERLWRYLPEDYPGMLSEQDARELIAVMQEDHHQVMAVVANDAVVGQVRMLSKGADCAEISYWLGVPHWGKGYASRIVRQFSDQYLRQNPQIKRLLAVVHHENGASRAVLNKAAYSEVSRDADWVTLERSRT